MAKELSKIVSQINSLIEIGDGTWRKIAELLEQVRDGKLYLQDGHKSFSKFVESEWGRKRCWAYRLMKADAVVKRLTTKVVSHGQQPTERAARALSAVPEELREAVVEHIADAHRPVTSATVRQAAAVVAKPKEAVVDNDGNEIPPHALKFWNRRQEVQDVLTILSKLRTQLEARMKAGDNMWCMYGVDQRLQSDLKAMYETVKNFMPWAVCIMCQGKCLNGCDACHNTGMVSEEHYKNISSKKLIEIRHNARRSHAS